MTGKSESSKIESNPKIEMAWRTYLHNKGGLTLEELEVARGAFIAAWHAGKSDHEMPAPNSNENARKPTSYGLGRYDVRQNNGIFMGMAPSYNGAWLAAVDGLSKLDEMQDEIERLRDRLELIGRLSAQQPVVLAIQLAREALSGESTSETGPAQTAVWQPIETAPNDVTILVARSVGTVELIAADDNDYDWRPYVDDGLDRPTHWMPAPEVPR